MPTATRTRRSRPARPARPLCLAGALCLALAAAPLRAQTVHSHYEQLLEKGTYALESGETAEAARLLRFACFGMLEAPPALADCLVRLAVAQAAEERDEELANTFRRLVEVEERFGAYADAPIPAGLRAAFESEAAARIPPRVLSATPAFTHLVPAEDGVAADSAAPVRPLETEGTSRSAGPDTLDASERARLVRARELLAAARDRSDLDEPWRLAREVADANPSAREPQHLAAVIAYRAARWQEAVRYFRQGGDPGDEAPERLFYYAVSLYEAGEREAAADALQRSLPHLEQTPFVRSYQSKILGDAGAELPGSS